MLVEIDRVGFSPALVHTDRNWVKTTFLGSGDSKTNIPTKISTEDFFTTTILSLYYCICEKVKGGRKTKGLQGVDWPEGDDKQMVELSNILK